MTATVRCDVTVTHKVIPESGNGVFSVLVLHILGLEVVVVVIVLGLGRHLAADFPRTLGCILVGISQVTQS
jgi:hypothetical protein